MALGDVVVDVVLPDGSFAAAVRALVPAAVNAYPYASVAGVRSA